MELLRDLWQRDKALVITFFVGVAVVLYLVYRQNNGSKATSTGNAPNEETPTVETEQLSTILAALGSMTPVTNTLQPIVTNNTTTTINNPAPTPTLTTTLTTPPLTSTTTVSTIHGIGNDTARDAAIKAAEKKYPGPSNAAKLQQAIAAIQKQYPRSGPTT